MDVTVESQIEWMSHTAGLQNTCGWQSGKLSRCRLSDGTLFYVREHIRLGDSFYTPANARIGQKRCDRPRGQQILELCCDDARFNDIAAAVRAADTLARPVLRNRRFTREWAEHEFQRHPGRTRTAAQPAAANIDARNVDRVV